MCSAEYFLRILILFSIVRLSIAISCAYPCCALLTPCHCRELDTISRTHPCCALLTPGHCRGRDTISRTHPCCALLTPGHCRGRDTISRTHPCCALLTPGHCKGRDTVCCDHGHANDTGKIPCGHVSRICNSLISIKIYW